MAGTHDGRVAVVTGAARGIGRAIALGLAQHGADVALLDLDDAEPVAEEVRSLGRRAATAIVDVADPEQVAAAAAHLQSQLGDPDILVNNAGIFPIVPFAELDLGSWRQVMSVNLDAQFICSKAFATPMRARGWGRVVNLTSNVVGLAIPGYSHYMASKMGVIGLTRGLANDLADDGVTVNAVGPTLTATPGVTEAIPPEVLGMVPQLQAIKRLGQPGDVVGVVLFLSSDDAAFVTGQTIMADGGLTRV